MERRTRVTNKLGSSSVDAKLFLKSVIGEILDVSGLGFEWLSERVHSTAFSGRLRVLWVSAGTSRELIIRATNIQGDVGYLHMRFPVEGDVYLIDRSPRAVDCRRDDNLRDVFG